MLVLIAETEKGSTPSSHSANQKMLPKTTGQMTQRRKDGEAGSEKSRNSGGGILARLVLWPASGALWVLTHFLDSLWFCEPLPHPMPP